MANLPTVNVTARINDQQGNPVKDAIVRMRLSTVEKYQGLVVPREWQETTDENGVAVLKVFPNELGSNGSEYHVTVIMPIIGNNNARLGAVSTAARTQKFSVVVPNTDCNLSDIANLPPYEIRGAGAVLPEEVAGYAAQAATNMDAARSYAEQAQSAKSSVDLAVPVVEAAKRAAQTAQSNAEAAAQIMRQSAESMQATSQNFETQVVSRTETAVNAYIAEGEQRIASAKIAALDALEEAKISKINEATRAIANAQTGAVNAIDERKTSILRDFDAAFNSAKEELQEIGSQYEEDFAAQVERAQGAARRAACSAAAATRNADRACECMGKVERMLNEAEAVVREVAVELLTPQVISETTRLVEERVQRIANDVDQALHDTAVSLLVPDIVTDAVQRATQRACECADTAVQSADIAVASARTAKIDADRAEEMVRGYDEFLRVLDESQNYRSQIEEKIDALALSTGLRDEQIAAVVGEHTLRIDGNYQDLLSRLADQDSAIRDRIDECASVLDQKIDNTSEALDQRIDDTKEDLEQQIDEVKETLEERMTSDEISNGLIENRQNALLQKHMIQIDDLDQRFQEHQLNDCERFSNLSLASVTNTRHIMEISEQETHNVISFGLSYLRLAVANGARIVREARDYLASLATSFPIVRLRLSDGTEIGAEDIIFVGTDGTEVPLTDVTITKRYEV